MREPIEGATQPPQVTKNAFDEIDETVDEFELVLATYGIKVRPGSKLEHACLILKDLKTRRNELLAGKPLGNWPTLQEDLRVGLGVLNFAQLAILHRSHPDFVELVPHLALLNEGMPAQTTRASVVDEPSNKILELRLAFACLRTGTGLRMDDPRVSSGGTNPDVVCKMSDGRGWGFACKVLHGDSPMTFAERFREGIEQIERSQADTGLVVVSFKNLLPHDVFLPIIGRDATGGAIFGAHRSHEKLIGDVSNDIGARVLRMAVSIGNGELARMLAGKKALTAVVSPVDLVTIATPNGWPLLMTLSFLRIVHLNHLRLPNSFDAAAERITQEINDDLALRENNAPMPVGRSGPDAADVALTNTDRDCPRSR